MPKRPYDIQNPGSPKITCPDYTEKHDCFLPNLIERVQSQPANSRLTLSCTFRALSGPGVARSAAARAIMRAIIAVTGIAAKGTDAAQCGQTAT
jgi:hypothetical protein